MKPAAPSLDHAYLHENYHRVGFGHILHEVLRIYCEQNLILMKQLRMALDQGNVNELSQLAHTIKGSSSSVGARAMELLAQSLEETTEQTDMSTITHMVEALEVEQARTEKAINEELLRMSKS